MPTGLLVATGTLDVAQFWPNKGSDADTANLSITSDSFQFSSTGNEQDLQTTHAFDGAKLKGQKKPVLQNNRLTVRFQGIDAAELHFAALLRQKGPNNKKLKNNGTKYRQHFGESAAVALGSFLKSHIKTTTCRIETRVDTPNEVFDIYGRFIGDAFVNTASGWVDVNHWLVQYGWAFPTYYNSMNPDEILTIQKLSDKAQKGSKGVWGHLTPNSALWDSTLVFRPGGPVQAAKDVGPVMMPKVFRRRTRYQVSRLNKLPDASGSFKDYLATLTDGWVTRKALLANPKMKKPPKNQNTLSPLVDVHDLFPTNPGDVVFFEAPSTLLGANGKPVTKF
jgi:endonuclease YncB( thermonuclease family)